MTDNRTADEIIAGIFIPPTSDRECELAQRVMLLQNYVSVLHGGGRGKGALIPRC